MAAIILIPALACWAVLAMGSARKALLWVYMPALLLLPQYYIFRLPHVPPITFADAAILPLGIALVFKEMRRWRWAWMDLWVLLFAASAGLSEALSTELANGDWTQLFSAELRGVAAARYSNRQRLHDVRCGRFEHGASLHGG